MDQVSLNHYLITLLDGSNIHEAMTQLSSLQLEQWEQLVDLATRHGVTPIIAWNLHCWKAQFEAEQIAVKQAIPDVVQSKLNHLFLVNGFGHEQRLIQLQEVLTTLQTADIRVIVLKGSYLANIIYAAGAARTMSDIDLLIPQEKLRQAQALLLENGYTTQSSGSISYQHLSPLRKADGMAVELHWTLITTDSAVKIDIAKIWSRAQPVTIAGVDVFTLSPEDLLLHLILHSALQHRFDMGLRPLCDIAATLRYFRGQLDWSQIEQRATEWEAMKSLTLTLHVVQRLFNLDEVTLPQQWLATHPVAPSLIAIAFEQIFERPLEELKMSKRLTQATTGTTLGALRGFKDALFLPKPLLARLYNTDPQSLRLYLYYFARLWYLCSKHGTALRQLLQRDSTLKRVAKREQVLLHWMEL